MNYKYDFFKFKEIHLQTHKDQAIGCINEWFFGCDKPTITDFKQQWDSFTVCHYIIDLIKTKSKSCSRVFIGDNHQGLREANKIELFFGESLFKQTNCDFPHYEIFHNGKYYFQVLTDSMAGDVPILCFYFE